MRTERASLPRLPSALAEAAIAELYEAHALGLTMLAHVMLGDKASAEDVVQDAFFGLYRNWAKLSDPAMALPYLRRSVLNGCKSVARWRGVRAGRALHQPASASAEAAVLAGEERQSVLPAIRRLPARQREVLILRFYLQEPDAEVARVHRDQARHGPIDDPPGACSARPDAWGRRMSDRGNAYLP